MLARPECLTPNVTIDTITGWLETRNIDIQYTPLVDGFHAAYNGSRILISTDLPEAYRLPTLAHETVHVHNLHTGPQPASVERQIDRLVANTLIDPAEYALWEREYDGHPGGIARALNLPIWVVEAFQSTIRTVPLAFPPVLPVT